MWERRGEGRRREGKRGEEREKINVSIRPGQYIAGGITSDDFGIFSFLSLSLPVVPLSLSLSPLPSPSRLSLSSSPHYFVDIWNIYSTV